MSVFKEVIEAAREALSLRDPALAKANQVVPPFEWRSKITLTWCDLAIK
jgi:hypothetical protein